MNKNDIVVTFEDENEIVIKLENKTFLNLQKKTVTPLTEEQVIRSDSGYEGLKEVIIEAVTSAIDNNIVSSNIKKNVTILGVQGTLDTPEYEGSYEITSNGTYATSGKKMTQDLVVNVEDKGSQFVQGDLASFESSIPTIVKANAFYSMTSLTSVSLPNVTYIYDSAFYQCSNLVNVNIPNVVSITNYAFRLCSKIEELNFNSLKSMGSMAFGGCSKLSSITIRTNQVCSLSGTGSIPATSSHHITLYVPSNLVESYKTATNWSTLYNNGYIDILAINE